MKKDMIFFDDEEKELFESVERGEWEPVKDQEKEKRLLREAAKNTLTRLRKEKMMTLRMNKEDLDGLKLKAKQAGLPYQTLVSTILHQYVKGQIQVRV